jgi:site-specific recombinase XerD
LTEKEVERFLPLPILAYRDYAILELLYATGARLGEIIYINIDDIDLSDRTILIRRRERKKRMVFFGRKAARILKFYLDVRPVLVREGSKEKSLFLSCYGRRMSGRAVHSLVEKYWFLSGIPRKITPQSFRHSFAAHLLDRGGDSRFVQELLGHSHIETTERYSSIKIGYLKTAHDKYHPRALEQPAKKIQTFEDITYPYCYSNLIRY